MQIFSRTPGEYLRLAAVPLAALALFAALRIELYRHSFLGTGAVVLAYEAVLLALIVRVRVTRFGNFKTLLPLVVMATATLEIVDGASLLIGRRASDSFLANNTDGPLFGLVALTLTVLVHWLVGSILLALLTSWTHAALALLFAFLLFATLVPQLGIGVPFLVMAASGLGFLVKLVWRKGTRVSAWLGYSGSVCLLAFLAMFIGGPVSCQLQMGDEATATRLVAAIEGYRQKNGHYPESLQSLVPDPLPALPLKFGQPQFPYFYRRGEDSFELAYPTGFKMGRRYHSQSREWENVD